MVIIYQPPTWQGVLVDEVTADKWVKGKGFRRSPPESPAIEATPEPEPTVSTEPETEPTVINLIELDEGDAESPIGVNINTASLAELVALPAIGMAKAKKLQAGQPNYRSASDLFEVVPSVDWDSLLKKGAIAL